MSINFTVSIGLEIHVRLNTEKKAFCGCRYRFGAPPNSTVCPVCLGLPGAMPVFNHEAAEAGITLALALGCRINRFSEFARKNYFYPDLPKGYQITQYRNPLAEKGLFEFDEGSLIRIRRVHIEEDAGKMIHGRDANAEGDSIVDLNRCGVPLAEIVTEPDITSPGDAKSFLIELRRLVRFLGISDGDMEKGSMRCDANVSIRPPGRNKLGTATEIKNLNSFAAVEKALNHEISRQIKIMRKGSQVHRETMSWNEKSEETVSMRNKEAEADYRYFPEPDLPPLVIDEQLIQKKIKELPETPRAMEKRFIATYGLEESVATLLTQSLSLAEYFEDTVSICGDAIMAANWIKGDILRLGKNHFKKNAPFPVSAKQLGKLLKTTSAGMISGTTAKKILETMMENGGTPEEIIEKEGLGRIVDEKKLLSVVVKAVKTHPKEVEKYRKGRHGVLGFFMGLIMQTTNGNADPRLASEILKRILDKPDEENM